MASCRTVRTSASALLLAPFATLVACGTLGTVDPGPPTGPPMGCNASPAFFLEHVWPEYLNQYSCGKSSCHDASSGHGYFRLESVAAVAMPTPGTPTSAWPEPWHANFAGAARFLSCADPHASLLLVVPEGRGQPHPPGDVVTDHAAADTLFLDWAHAP